MLVYKAKGFSLIELMIVVSIIGILASVAAPQFTQYLKKARMAEGSVLIDNLAKAEMSFYAKQTLVAQVGGGPGVDTTALTQNCFWTLDEPNNGAVMLPDIRKQDFIYPFEGAEILGIKRSPTYFGMTAATNQAQSILGILTSPQNVSGCSNHIGGSMVMNAYAYKFSFDLIAASRMVEPKTQETFIRRITIPVNLQPQLSNLIFEEICADPTRIAGIDASCGGGGGGGGSPSASP